ncbi:MAG: PAS domain S-box protein [Thioalkalispiraceae bacterium]|jgi:PAS domain S-box-containing protein
MKPSFELINQATGNDNLFRQLLEAAPDAIIIVNSDGCIILVNQMAEKMFGYERSELMGKPVEILLPEQFRDGHQRHRQAYFSDAHTRPMGSGLELHAQHKNGTQIPVEISLSPLQSDNGQLVTAVVRDISERQKAREALEQHARDLERSNAELEQFAYVASHDLQEPLRMVASYAQLLGRRYRDQLDTDADEFIDYIVDGATRMQVLINDLLAFSRIGTRGGELRATDTNAVLQRAFNNLQLAIEDNHAKISYDQLPEVMGDELQLIQLFQNLISNALKFHGEAAPVIHIGAQLQGKEILFSVADQGIGIEPQYRERIFLLFQRLHGKKEYPGTGIGLAICKKIVDRHSGKIWLESEPGKGTTFYFTLPTISEE